MRKIARRHWWQPNYIATSLQDIDTSELHARHITHLALDVDETLVPHGQNNLAAQDRDFLLGVQRTGIQLYLASNTRRDITTIARAIDALVIPTTRTSFKPLASYYQRIVRTAHARPEHIAMVGDRIGNDIWGPGRAGFVTVFVYPRTRRPGPLHRHYIQLVLKHTADVPR